MDTLSKFTVANLATLNRAAQREGWWIEMSKMSIQRMVLPPDDCVDTAAWRPPFADDHEARSYVAARAAQDLDSDSAVALHQLAMRVSQDWPETMILGTAVARARQADLLVTGERLEWAIGSARIAAHPCADEKSAWGAAWDVAAQRFPAFKGGAVRSAAQVADATPKQYAAAELFDAIASYVLGLRRRARLALSRDETEPQRRPGSDGQQDQPPPSRTR